MYNNGYYNNSKLEKIILQLIQEAKLASFLFISLIGYHYIARRVPHKKFAILSQNSHHTKGHRGLSRCVRKPSEQWSQHGKRNVGEIFRSHRKR